ncbi:organic hydroperoxide resistance protein [Lacticigenium naphthae]|uniref:organic hydroperoxide resistance protein n=1 Tax=Lacticigenium naphthae TaxID=515351 RepID=UPI0003F5D866|nr:organic hydroperoxide resistance protein [Lacticigenium naphthae]
MTTEKEQVYEAVAVNTGGRDGESHLLDRTFEVRVSTPKDMGGPGQGTNPEQLYAMGHSACYHSALEHYKAQEKITNPSQIIQTVRLLNDPSDGGFKLASTIEVAIKDMDLEKVQVLAEKAHAYCPYSKATKGNVDYVIRAIEYEEGK